MSTVNGNVSGLNSDVYSTLQRIRSNNSGPLTAQDAQELKQAIEKGGLDDQEKDLIQELLTEHNKVQVYGEDASFGPNGLSFEGVSPEARQILEDVGHVERLENPETPEGEHGAPGEVSLNELLHKAEHSENEHDFAVYAEEILHAKFGLKNEHAGAIAKNLFVAFHDPDPVKKARAIAETIVHLNETPKGKEAITRLTAPLIQKLPADSPMRKILTKLFSDKSASDSRIRFLATVMDGKFEGLKDIRATYELLNDFGPEIKALLPENVKDHIERLETLFGAKMGEHVKDILKNVLPMGENSDFVRATMKFITGDGVNKVSAGIDFLNSVGKRIVGADNETLKAIYGFLKVDGRTGDALRHLLNPHAPVQLRAEALEHLAHTFHERLDKVMEHFGVEHGDDVLKHAHEPAPETGKTGDAHPTEEPHSTTDAPDTPKTTGADELATAEGKAAEEALKRETQVAETAKKLGLNPESEAALAKIFSDPKMDEKAFQEGMQMLEKMGAEEAQAAFKVLQHMEPDIARRIFTNGQLGEKALQGMMKMMPALERMGMSMLEVAPKLAKGLGKILPVAGAVVSGYDAVRLGSIAATGKDLSGKEYKDPDVRALALLGAGANGLDTALAVLEATGVGNVDLPVQLGLAGVEVAIDLMVEYYNEHPEKMPQELRLGIKAAALGVAVGAPFVMPPAGLAATAAVANIYGLDGTIDIANELTRLTGETALKGIDKLTELHAKAMDRGLEGLTDGLNGLADVIRNPEKYAQQMGKSVEEVMGQAYDLLKKKAGEGIEAAKQVYGVLKDIATNPGAYAQKAVDFAVETGIKLGNDVAYAAGAAVGFVKDMAVKGAVAFGEGVKALYDLGADGVKAAKDLIGSALRKGGQVAQDALAFARDVVNNPAKYGEMAGEMAAQAAAALRDAVKAGIAKAGDALVALKDMAVNGVESAVQGMKDIVSAGGAMAAKALTYISEVPEKVAHAIGEGLQAAYRAGKATVDMAKWVAQNPQAALQKLGTAGQQVLTSTRDFLIDTAKSAGKGAADALKYLEGLYDRTGAALGRFGDTLVDLMKQGVNVGKDMVGRYWDVIKKRGPELISALGNLGKAGIDLMTKIGQWQTDAAKWVVDGLSNAVSTAGSAVKSYALQKLNEIGATDAIVKLVNQGKATLSDLKKMGSQAIEAIKKYGNPEALGQLLNAGMVKASDMISSLMSQGADGIRKLVETTQHYGGLAKEFIGKLMAEMGSAWDQSSITNGYAPLRHVIGKYLDQAAAAGGEAVAWMKQQLVSALDTMDKNMERAQAGNWVVVSIPDSIINALR
ncbi:hypothetical protein COW36_07300 [bacterium (Candidatus Blackallbacteria) CG17_big_fil_post_rev_8_21_14_2_50_48_46]|uniref:Uncharacterized protein n=1 Tax=bacterium (Candidatus Blackallbacteria) CG17_big_fil_post_rev_8_21_14_2_50_48_46 TaxID=2014261 RepID=A0A2M7G738_9BACT|nr:MAG: hypothetical protein COW64_06810 [bacterium (Candidatus Blackallbacteria) CG18_big_fil_WC_8_21_14_2_50_49_26]PIW17868.1 MAG: hypothetical protein COW36_07300 [bacterium (Candidatus Blackallbacteria) CG17_big_fil_post_rev_8_21_14_2_50_48_46]PIW48544.1 MAG: hypothetical protein COW20_09255 [bacterium (Candidatus Blackallbacteria) CG13_big_fil_rev_8_21_14_2_50_49_14]